jgi:hypothetical protein
LDNVAISRFQVFHHLLERRPGEEDPVDPSAVHDFSICMGDGPTAPSKKLYRRRKAVLLEAVDDFIKEFNVTAVIG